MHIKFLHQDKGIKVLNILNIYLQYSKSSIYRHAKANIAYNPEDRRHTNARRPKLLTERDERKIITELHRVREQEGTFTSKRLQVCAGVTHVTNHTIRKRLNKAAENGEGKARN